MKQAQTDRRDDSPARDDGARALSRAGAPAQYRLGRAFSLGANRQYQYVYRRGKSYPDRLMVLIYLRAREMRVGFSVSSKVGNSVTRNRVRRRMMEDFRLLRPSLKPGKYIFVARTAAAGAPYPAMRDQMEKLLRRARLFREETIP